MFPNFSMNGILLKKSKILQNLYGIKTREGNKAAKFGTTENKPVFVSLRRRLLEENFLIIKFILTGCSIPVGLEA